MKTIHKLRTNELTNIEKLLVQQIYTILNRKDELIEEITKNAEDYNKLISLAGELKALNNSGILKTLQEQFWDLASEVTLTKIVESKSFAPEVSYLDPVEIDKRVILKFSSFREFKHGQPKSELAKKLGAKIVA